MMIRMPLLAGLIACALALSGPVLAQQVPQAQQAPPDADALAKAAQNPLASLVTLPLQEGGPDGQVRVQVNFMFPTGG